jgi:hypothetical protein
MHDRLREELLATDWPAMTVGQMWAAIGEFDQAPASAQSSGWDRAFELLDAHRARLEEYRDLAERSWQGPTADAFVAQVNELISAVVVARDAAVANEPVLPHLSGSMVEARAALAPIHEKWTANQARAAAGGAPPVVGGLQRRGANSPVPDDVLHQQAVTVMQTLSSRLLEGYHAMRIPPLYESEFPRGPQPHDPAPPSAPGRSDGGRSSRHSDFSSDAFPMAGSPGSPSLAGVPMASSPVVPGPAGPSPLASSGSATSPVVGPVIGVIPPGIGGDGSPPGRSSGAGSQWTRPGVRGLPPGGVINGPPEGGEPGRPAARAPRANPVGGVIGPTTGRETEGMFAPAAGGAGGRSTERRLGRNRDYDTDEHWPAPKGVPPVLGLPGPEPVHDPGMPVIGMHVERDRRRDR